MILNWHEEFSISIQQKYSQSERKVFKEQVMRWLKTCGFVYYNSNIQCLYDLVNAIGKRSFVSIEPMAGCCNSTHAYPQQKWWENFHQNDEHMFNVRFMLNSSSAALAHFLFCLFSIWFSVGLHVSHAVR